MLIAFGCIKERHAHQNVLQGGHHPYTLIFNQWTRVTRLVSNLYARKLVLISLLKTSNNNNNEAISGDVCFAYKYVFVSTSHIHTRPYSWLCGCMFSSSDEKENSENMTSADFHFLIYKYFLSRSASHHYPALNSLQNVTLLDKWCC